MSARRRSVPPDLPFVAALARAGGDRGLRDRLGILVEGDVGGAGRLELLDDGVHVVDVLLGELEMRSQTTSTCSRSAVGMAKSSQFAFDRLRPLSTNSWMETIEAAGASRTTERSSVSPTWPEDARPVVEQVLVADEDARALPRRALREERLVEPAGCAADVALPMPVRALLRVDHRRGVAKQRGEARRDAGLFGAAPPERQEPGEARVLDEHVLGGPELLPEPAGELVVRTSRRERRRRCDDQAAGRASETWTAAFARRRVWKSTTHWDSAKPRGFVASAGTSG